MLAGALLEQSEALLDRGIHPIRIADGFDRACAVAVEQLNRICETMEFSHENTENLLKTAKTSLGSKMYVHLAKVFNGFLIHNLKCLERAHTVRPNRRRCGVDRS